LIGRLYTIGLPVPEPGTEVQLPLHSPVGVPEGTLALILERTSDLFTVLTPYGILVISSYYLTACI